MSEKIKIKSRVALDRITPYTPGKPIWEVQKELGLDRVIKLASNENPYGTSDKAIQAIIEQVQELHRYPDASATSLRAAIATKIDMNDDQVVVTNGADELITLISEAFLEANDEIIVTSPTFSEYEFGAHLMGANIVQVPLGPLFSFDVDALLASVTERTKIVFICSPNNPTGTYITKTDLQRLLEYLPEQVLIVYDAAYSHYATASDYSNGLEFVRAGFPIIVLHTFSKIYGLAGIRVGFGVGTVQIISCILKVKEPFNVNTLAQSAATAALSDNDHVYLCRMANEYGREQLYKEFRNLRLPFTQSMSNFILLELGPDARSIYEQLLKLGIIARYGGTWGLPEYLRITVGTIEENDLFLYSLTEILENRGQMASAFF